MHIADLLAGILCMRQLGSWGESLNSLSDAQSVAGGASLADVIPRPMSTYRRRRPSVSPDTAASLSRLQGPAIRPCYKRRTNTTLRARKGIKTLAP